MKAAALVANKKFELIEVEQPKPKRNEVSVNIAACGVCSSELHVWLDERVVIDKPRFMGHEASGIVQDVGEEVSGYSVGDRVVIYPYQSGAYAESICVPEHLVMKLADEIPFEHALGEPLGCAMNATKRAAIEVGDTVAIIGLGFMGSLILQGAKLSGACQIIAIDTREEVLQLAKQLGATVTINAKTDDVAEQIRLLTDGAGVDVVIEATGFQQPLDLATELVKIRGRLVIYGYHQGGTRSVDMKTWNWKGLDVVNAHERDPNVYMNGIRTGIKLLEAGLLDMKLLVTHIYSLEQVNEAFDATHRKPEGFMKAVIMPLSVNR
jgi:threonine dehydrogenase-like Zn-dependent dehydrogenase